MKKSIRMMSVVTFLICLAFGALSSQAQSIVVTNYQGGETLRYPVALIRGTVADKGLTSVEVVNGSSKRDTAKLAGQAYQGKFVALTELVPGENAIVIKAGADSCKLTLQYKVQTNPYVVRLIYFTSKEGETQLFDTLQKEEPKDFAGRMGMVALLMQTFSAEKMNDLGYGRVTFNLEFDENAKVKVHVVKGDLAKEEYQKMGRSLLWKTIRGEINAKMPSDQVKNMVIPAFSYFNRQTGKNVAYTAEGGKDMALFGGSNMYCWPRTLADVQKCFSDDTPIDKTMWCDDSAGRHVYWANASTSIGACMHELGHTFSLFHVRDSQGIMSRGMDRFSRVFVPAEAADVKNKAIHTFKDDEVAHWAVVSGEILRCTRWFALDDRKYEPVQTTMKLDEAAGELVISSPLGIGGVDVGSIAYMIEPIAIDIKAAAPKTVAISMSKYGKLLHDDKAVIHVIDTQGNVTFFHVNEYLPGATTKAATAPAK